MKFYWHEFEDGYRIAAAGFDRVEMQRIIAAHGKLIGKYPAE